MKKELLISFKTNERLSLDPRTKLSVLIAISIFIIGGSYKGMMQYYIILLAAIPLLLFIVERKWRAAFIYFLLFGSSLFFQLFILPSTQGGWNYLMVAFINIFLRFTPSVGMGYFLVTTTTVSEFMASMEKMHIPKHITIPMSVMFRFFLTVIEEWRSIGDAMKMRNIKLGKRNLFSLLEYRLVPMIICSVKIGEELSIASLTRGLGGPVKRTNICEVGFRIQDVFFLIIVLGAFAVSIGVWLGWW